MKTANQVNPANLAAPKQCNMLLYHTVRVFLHESSTLVLHGTGIVVDNEGRGGRARLGEMGTLSFVRGVELLDQQTVTPSRHLGEGVCGVMGCVL